MFAFEPMAENLEMLRRSICLNPGFAERITLFTHPLSAKVPQYCACQRFASCNFVILQSP